jgi:O-antigen/teichoic acid export membrane protein
VLGAIVPVAAVAYYAAPQEAVTKALVIPTALNSVMFPAYSAERVDDSPRLGDYRRRSIRYTFFLMFPATVAIAALAPEILSTWLGTTFAANGASAMRWFSLGVLVNGIAVTPSAFLQARGAAASVAVLQLIEVPLFAGGLALATLSSGLAGAAAAWCARAAADLCCLLALARRSSPSGRALTWSGVGISLAVAASFLAVSAVGPMTVRLAVLAVVLALSGVIGWRTADGAEREAAAIAWNRLRRAPGA